MAVCPRRWLRVTVGVAGTWAPFLEGGCTYRVHSEVGPALLCCSLRFLAVSGQVRSPCEVSVLMAFRTLIGAKVT